MARLDDLLAEKQRRTESPGGRLGELTAEKQRRLTLATPEQPRPDVSGVQAAQQLSPTEAVLARAGAEFSRIIPNLQRLVTSDPELSKQAEEELAEIDRRVQELGVGQPVSAFGAPLAQAPVAVAGLGASLLAGLPLAARVIGGATAGAAGATAFAPTEADIETTAAIGGALGGALPEVPALLTAGAKVAKDIAKPVKELVEEPVSRAIKQGRVFTSDLFPP